MSEDNEDKDRDWSALNSQVVGAESFYDVAKQLPPQSTELEQKWEDDRQHLQQRIAELTQKLDLCREELERLQYVLCDQDYALVAEVLDKTKL